jgi:hypothetical protein
MRRKKAALSTQPGEFKGTVSRDNEWGFIPRLRKNKVQTFFLADLPNSFCTLGEGAKLRKRMINGLVSAGFGSKSKSSKSLFSSLKICWNGKKSSYI